MEKIFREVARSVGVGGIEENEKRHEENIRKELIAIIKINLSVALVRKHNAERLLLLIFLLLCFRRVIKRIRHWMVVFPESEIVHVIDEKSASINHLKYLFAVKLLSLK